METMQRPGAFLWEQRHSQVQCSSTAQLRARSPSAPARVCKDEERSASLSHTSPDTLSNPGIACGSALASRSHPPKCKHTHTRLRALTDIGNRKNNSKTQEKRSERALQELQRSPRRPSFWLLAAAGLVCFPPASPSLLGRCACVCSSVCAPKTGRTTQVKPFFV